MTSIPCVRAAHLTATEKRIVRLPLNRLSEKGRWTFPELKVEMIELVDRGIEIEDTAFTVAEYDQITIDDKSSRRARSARTSAGIPSLCRAARRHLCFRWRPQADLRGCDRSRGLPARFWGKNWPVWSSRTNPITCRSPATSEGRAPRIRYGERRDVRRASFRAFNSSWIGASTRASLRRRPDRHLYRLAGLPEVMPPPSGTACRRST